MLNTIKALKLFSIYAVRSVLNSEREKTVNIFINIFYFPICQVALKASWAPKLSRAGQSGRRRGGTSSEEITSEVTESLPPSSPPAETATTTACCYSLMLPGCLACLLYLSKSD